MLRFGIATLVCMDMRMAISLLLFVWNMVRYAAMI